MYQNYQLKWCFILIGILVVGTGLVKISNFETLHLLQFLGNILSIVISVLIAWLIIGYFKRHNVLNSNQANTIVSIVLSIMALLAFSYFVLMNMPSKFYISDLPYEATIADLVRRGVGIFFLTMICYIVYTTLFTHEILQKTKLENEQFKQAHLRAQLLSLQEQISPHFLFNSLSTLKTITHETDTKQFVVHLSHVYRYLLNINKHFKKTDEELDSYDVAHHAGMNLEEEYEFLQLMREDQRQEYLKRHLIKVLPIVAGMDALKEKVKLNGHFRDLKGFEW